MKSDFAILLRQHRLGVAIDAKTTYAVFAYDAARRDGEDQLTQYSDSLSLNGQTLGSNYFYTASASESGAGNSNGMVYYNGNVTANGSAGISGTISSSGNGYFTVTPTSGPPTTYQVLGSTADGNNLIFEAAQTEGSNQGPYYILAGSGASPTTSLDYDSRNTYHAPVPVCFAAGTLILTMRGEIVVEALTIDDVAITAGGERRPVRWIGSTRVHVHAYKRPQDVAPIAFMAGSLGDGLPSQELLVSPGHRLLIGDTLFQAESLVNGLTIVRRTIDVIDYYHVELDSPDALVANGAAAESFVDVGNRPAFNAAIGLPSVIPMLDADPLTETFAPNVKDGPKLAAVRTTLIERALTMGWSRVVDKDVALEVSGVRIEAAARVGDRHWFVLAKPASSVVLLSQAAICSDVKPDVADDRKLGVQLLSVIADGREVQLHAPTFSAGFHDCEEADERLFRWTNGYATLQFGRSVRVVEILVGRGAELIVADTTERDCVSIAA